MADYGDDAALKNSARAQAKQARIILERLRQTRAAARAERSAGSSEFAIKVAYADQPRMGPDANLRVVEAIGRCIFVEQVQEVLCAFATTNPAFTEPHLLEPADARERRLMSFFQKDSVRLSFNQTLVTASLFHNRARQRVIKFRNSAPWRPFAQVLLAEHVLDVPPALGA